MHTEPITASFRRAKPTDLRLPNKPTVLTNLYARIRSGEQSLIDLTMEQQRLHESRRWSTQELLAAVNSRNISDTDKDRLRNVGRTDATTNLRTDRLARLADQECRRWVGKNDVLSTVIHACGTWSRYWNEEESRHEAVFKRLASMLNLESISNDKVIGYRKVFPDGNLLRTMTLLAISEITSAVNYAGCAKRVRDPGLKAIFKQVGADEVQHMKYFIAFARACVDSGEFHPKGAFSEAYFLLRKSGDRIGRKRRRVEQHGMYVNGWDGLGYVPQGDNPNRIEKKQRMVFNALEGITGVPVKSIDDLEDTWLGMVGYQSGSGKNYS